MISVCYGITKTSRKGDTSADDLSLDTEEKFEEKFGIEWHSNPKLVNQDTMELLVFPKAFTYDSAKANGQLEDRVFTEKGIENFTKYIAEAIIYVPREHVTRYHEDEFGDSYRKDIAYLNDAVDKLKNAGVPIRYVSSMKTLNNSKSNDPNGVKKLIDIIGGTSS